MKSKEFTFVLILAVFLASCSNSTDAINSKMDSTYAYLADLQVEQVKVYNQTFKNPEITAAIEEYSKAKTVSDKLKSINRFKPENPADVTWVKTETWTKKTGQIDFSDFIKDPNPEKFDLAIKNNDVVVRQVKLMNRYFGELDNETLNAIAFYEKLNNDEKTKLFLNNTKVIPAPDYAIRYLGRELQRVYLLQRLQLMEQLRRNLLTRRIINEFPQGFRHPNESGFLDNEKQFDLKLALK